MFVYNARREDWIKENDESVFEISGYDRPHVYVFVSDKKFPLWRLFSKISGYGRKIRWIRAVSYTHLTLPTNREV